MAGIPRRVRVLLLALILLILHGGVTAILYQVAATRTERSFERDLERLQRLQDESDDDSPILLAEEETSPLTNMPPHKAPWWLYVYFFAGCAFIAVVFVFRWDAASRKSKIQRNYGR